ncbi:glycoside hydrolase family 2 protein [Roseimaritima ulvae]|uniref:Beta-galactosidase n=1 Tax=Roseimaritima ulvae TaxID=980254 RepID=A0A5B9QK34_9BACT|nr:glycoside hydrolase family 2 [Roseimaritima ulvae]QEG38339.1 Beta-galactosidase [Roseimaritima ulvae]
MFDRTCWRCCLTGWLIVAACCLASVVPVAAEQIADPWRYSFEQPADNWQRADFDDTTWRQGRGGFGTQGTPAARIGTVWKTSDIWLRKSFQLDAVPEHPALLIHHDEDAEVYINGQRVLAVSGWSVDYAVVELPEQHHQTLRAGENLLAVHCHQNTGGQYIDVQVVDGDNPPPPPPAIPFQSDLITRWGAELDADNVWAEYPRPQLVRNHWQNLNGHWDYAVRPLAKQAGAEQAVPQKWDGEILVPFCLESKLGGVQRLLGADESLWYRRTFEASSNPGRRTLLNFEAVDYRCEVFVNGTSVGRHQGGNTPFSFDITDALRSGENELVVRVEDETEAWQLRGKQVLEPRGIWYTRVSGIWQTVWLEQVASSHVVDLKIHTDVDTGRIEVQPHIEGKQAVETVRLVVKDGDRKVAELQGGTDRLAVTIPDAKLWSPSSPHLYDLEVTLLNPAGDVLDQVSSYAGIRAVGKTRDADGHRRMTLNGQTLFHWGPLDQGWWPDGLLTPPSDEAMLFDIEYLKAAGFNMIRKHIKVEPRRYYYHCDRLGMMVWQDQVSAGHNPPWTRLKPNPEDADWPDDPHAQFMLELERMIDSLENHPSIVVWVPFNEAWGQHRTVAVGKWTVERDPTRLVNVASGGNFWPVGDIVDHHSYPHPNFPFAPQRYGDFIKVVGEFGGHGYPVKGHLWDAQRDNWGYGGLPKTKQEYLQRYVTSLEKLQQLKQQGIAAGVYTQTTDVEGEINGLMTYDRKQIKIPAKQLAELHRRLWED